MTGSTVSVSKSTSLTSALGALMALVALGYSTYSLASLERQKADAANQLVALTEQANVARKDIELQRAELDRVRRDAQSARQAVAASRAAINAFHAGRIDDAVRLYDEALGPDPNNAYLQNLRAYSLFRLGRLNEAIDGVRKSIEADPLYAWAYFDLARFLCASGPGGLDEASKAVKRAVELRPDMTEIMKKDGEFQRLCRERFP
ncbi:MAG: tetratricopeptide repeat protein [Vicinamibacterales bacterium]